MVIYISKYILYFNANKIKGGIAMLKYISKILRDAPNTHLHNALYNMLNDSTFRENITYNPKSDKFVQGAPEKFNVASLDLDMIGTYKNFENFLKDLYKHEHFLEITSIDIEPYEKDKKVLLIKFVMKLYAQK